ncbi:hypothetical protein KGQ20_07715 [Catenulispora sp. NF23]|uniref:Alkaline shock response membrane anchor protein AmaP n=1 Tax=Catenulispora pinistramenti TaxID=2705254 RepID=A0ABS5KNJ6_9ACTN|nr:hypothetical protein [Catenulispora pinistramenti]MBS2532658.1 hypothetical protein [Catenulispora pinistramenti]MBS2547585.1 hypothetical protein [Catenulispora pinistramenti]
MTTVIVNRLLLAVLGLVCVALGLWLLTARYAAHLLPGSAVRYVATGPDRSLAGPTTRSHLREAVHGWYLPGALTAVCLLAALFLVWQYVAVRMRTLRLGTARVDAQTLARRICAEARDLDEVASARAHFVTTDPPRLRLILRPRPEAEPARLLAGVRSDIVPGIGTACGGAVPGIEIRIVGRRSRRGRPARVK